MDVLHGIGLFVLGMIITLGFFIIWFRAMENEDSKYKNKPLDGNDE